jgi:glutathione S-transferase
MILIGQFDSPFVRRVAIAMELYGLQYEHRPVTAADVSPVTGRGQNHRSRSATGYLREATG